MISAQTRSAWPLEETASHVAMTRDVGDQAPSRQVCPHVAEILPRRGRG